MFGGKEYSNHFICGVSAATCIGIIATQTARRIVAPQRVGWLLVVTWSLLRGTNGLIITIAAICNCRRARYVNEVDDTKNGRIQRRTFILLLVLRLGGVRYKRWNGLCIEFF